jgi:hypothetical protein
MTGATESIASETEGEKSRDEREGDRGTDSPAALVSPLGIEQNDRQEHQLHVVVRHIFY